MAFCLPTVNSQWSPSKAAARRVTKRKSQFYCTIDLSGFLSIELALLLMFMANVPSAHYGVSVDLPHVKNVTAQPGANREDVMRVVVSRDGNTYFGRSKIAVSELHGRLRAEVQNGSEAKVYLYADARARNADVEAVVNEIQLAGIQNIAIIAWGPSGAQISPAPQIPFLYPFYFPGIHHIPAG